MLTNLLTQAVFDLLTRKAGQVARGLWRTWPAVSGEVARDRPPPGLAAEAAFSVVLPPAILAHELGHALATRQVGGAVAGFQWRVFWGSIVPAGSFTSLWTWWVALVGNLVSLTIGLLPHTFLGRLHHPCTHTLWSAFVQIQLGYVLISDPAISFAGFAGDWPTIYNTRIGPVVWVGMAVPALLIWRWRWSRGGGRAVVQTGFRAAPTDVGRGER